ncbi:MAG: hypothetical protein ACPG51_19315 [Thiolinea sp.]
MKISVIVPLAPGDESWRVLVQDLALLDDQGALTGFEVLLVSADSQMPEALTTSMQHHPPEFAERVSLVAGGESRASSMNKGAGVAQGDYLWFVHADSRLEVQHIRALTDAIASAAGSLYYFDLKFYGHPLMWVNEGGVWIRSHLLMTPFGDQALCIAREQFVALGGYPEDVVYGEDHLLVWYAMQHGIKLHCTGEALLTSARKYEDNGWLNTTGLHLWLWAKQAWPEFMVLMKKRWLKAG